MIKLNAMPNIEIIYLLLCAIEFLLTYLLTFLLEVVSFESYCPHTHARHSARPELLKWLGKRPKSDRPFSWGSSRTMQIVHYCVFCRQLFGWRR